MAEAVSRKLILTAVLALTGCATNTSPSVPMTADELHQHCAAQMYAARRGTGRSAPNWNWYDYCMKNSKALSAPSN
jgi:hypothetical protein